MEPLRGAPCSSIETTSAIVRRSRPLLATLLLCVLGGSAPAIGAERTDAELLAGADLFAEAPPIFRALLAVKPEGSASETRMELYRSGRGSARDQAVIRLLAPKDLGKYFLKSATDFWFFAPGAKKPVRLAAGYKLAGASLDEILGLSFTRDYRLTGGSRAGGVATLDLEAVAPTASYQKVRLAIAAATGLPLRIELRTREGKVLRMVEVASWKDAARRVPEELVLKDLLRGGAPLRIRFLEIEPVELPASFFALDGGSARELVFKAAK